MTHDAEPYEAPRRHYSTAAVGIDVSGRTWRRGVSSEGWITVGKGHNQFGQTVDLTGAVDPPLQTSEAHILLHFAQNEKPYACVHNISSATLLYAKLYKHVTGDRRR